MLLVVICRWCDVDVCRDPGNVSTSIIAQHTVSWFESCTRQGVWVCDPEFASRGLCAIARDNGRTT